jgi:DNA-binding LacI/PurR family transcriptional regulator
MKMPETVILKENGKKLYEAVESRIIGAIKQGRLKPGQRLDSQDDFAKDLNVSEGTVRHALQRLAAKGIIVRKPRLGTFVNDIDMPDSIKINPTASRNIALLVPQINCPDWANLAGALHEVGHERCLDILIGNISDSTEKLYELVERHIKSNVYGICLGFSVRSNWPNHDIISELVVMLKESRIPVVTIFCSIDWAGWPAVCSDIGAQSYMAAKHLCDIGRKKIGFVGTNRPINTFATEFTVTQHGYMKALAENGVKYHPALQFEINDWTEERVTETGDQSLLQAIEQWIDSNPEMDAICCSNDHTAFPILTLLEKLGKRVPEDVAVTGCGNHSKYHRFSPGELTTVDICINEISEKACQLLHCMRRGEEVNNKSVAIKGKLLLGRSTIG